MNNTEGNHLIIELTAARNSSFLDDEKTLMSSFEKYIQESKATILYKHSHKFKPSGVTGIFVLSESHLSFHTWPDQGYASIDFYTCGKADSDVILSGLMNDFQCSLHVTAVKRGCENMSRFFSSIIWHKDFC